MHSAAICIIGSELVRGIIADAHGKTISSDLTRLGYDVRKIIVIPDDGSIGSVLAGLYREVDLVIATGGLGPTSDDITRDAVAEVYDAPLEIDEDEKKVLVERVGARLNNANLRQVMIPRGFTVLKNPVGSAPGFSLRGAFYALPGPPREMLTMWNGKVMPDLMALEGVSTPQQRLEASVFLVPESALEEACRTAVRRAAEKHGLSEDELPLWGTRVQLYRISLYLQGESDRIRRAVFTEIQEELGPELVREGDLEAFDILVSRLAELGLTVAGAESCTGGLVGKLLSDAPGSSGYFWGSLTTYANSAKERVLDVPGELIERFGAVSKECAQKMAEGVYALSGADAVFSITGIAGPDGGTDEKPVGTVWFGISSLNGGSVQVKMQFHPYSRDSIRRRSSIAAALLLDQHLAGAKLLDIISRWQYS